MKAINTSIIQGRVSTLATAMTISFGTNVSVNSWIEVAACTTDTTSPTTSDSRRIGAETISVV